jgi:tetratricopeptide (TPR) repeat protein
MEYYYLRGSDRVGPVSLSELKSLDGLGYDTLVQPGGLSRWVRAAGLPELSEYFALNPPERDYSFYESAEYAATTRYYRLLITIFPERAHYYMGESYSKLKKYAKAITCFQTYTDLDLHASDHDEMDLPTPG